MIKTTITTMRIKKDGKNEENKEMEMEMMMVRRTRKIKEGRRRTRRRRGTAAEPRGPGMDGMRQPRVDGLRRPVSGRQRQWRRLGA